MGRRLAAGLVAGILALIANAAVLVIADNLGIKTGHGGLLLLLSIITGVRIPSGWEIGAGFHAFVGLGMAMVYAAASGPRVVRHPVVSGLVAAAAVWLPNALVVLPATGAGVAGSHRIGVEGMIWFAVAHTTFFLVLAILFARRINRGGIVA